MTIRRACEIILLPEDHASAIFSSVKTQSTQNRKERKMFKLQFASLEDVLSFMLDFSDVTGLTISRNANADSLVQTFIFNSEFENIDAKYWNKGIEDDKKVVHERGFSFFKTQSTQNRKERKMQYRVTFSTADGDETKDFNTWEDAHLYANEWMNGFTHRNHRHFNSVETDNYENLWKTRKGETVRIEKIDCPNCEDQASIAAPGETVLCKTHSDENHYAEMKEFFIEEIERLQFKSLLPFCSACGTDKRVVYVGLIPTKNSGILSFSFCVDCRDELTLKKNAAIAAQERIGA